MKLLCHKRVALGCAAAILGISLSSLSNAGTRLSGTVRSDNRLCSNLETLDRPLVFNRNGVAYGISTSSDDNHRVAGEGRYFFFVSQNSARNANNQFIPIIPSLPTSEWGLFRRDLETGEFLLADKTLDNHSIGSNPSSVTENGDRVYFYSYSDKLVAGDTNGESDIFEKNFATGELRRINVSPDGSQVTNGYPGSFGPVVSGNGRFVAFEAPKAKQIVPSFVFPNSGNVAGGLVMIDQSNNQRFYLSYAPNGAPLGGWSSSIALSIPDSGDLVAFSWLDANRQPAPGRWASTVFMRDVSNQITIQIAPPVTQTNSNVNATNPRISANAKVMLWLEAEYSSSGTLGAAKLKLFDLVGRAPIPVPSSLANAEVSYPQISADGNVITFVTNSRLNSNDTDNLYQAYTWNRSQQSFKRLGIDGLAVTPALGSTNWPYADRTGMATSFYGFAQSYTPGFFGDLFVLRTKKNCNKLEMITSTPPTSAE